MRIADRDIGPGHPVFIVAEIGPNHCGRLELARQLVRAAKDAGADAVKFQLYTPDEMTLQSDDPRFRIKTGPWAGRTLWDLYAEGQTPREWMPELFELARSIGIIPFASVFSPDGVAFLESLECPAYKIASAEVEYPDLLDAVADTGKPILLSDGMTDVAGSVRAEQIIRRWHTNMPVRARETIWLRCVSEYPADSYGFRDLAECDEEECGRRFAWGLSDHSLGHDVAAVAVAIGACVVEKHLMLDWVDYNPPGQRWACYNSMAALRRGQCVCGACPKPLDARHSVAPDAFRKYVNTIRRVETMLRTDHKPSESAEQWRRRPVVIDGVTHWVRCAAEEAVNAG